MATRGPTLIYVHGAGAQPPEADWIRVHNQILFADRPAPTTDLAYYADLIQQFDTHLRRLLLQVFYNLVLGRVPSRGGWNGIHDGPRRW